MMGWLWLLAPGGVVIKDSKESVTSANAARTRAMACGTRIDMVSAFSNVVAKVALYGKFTRAVTFENFC
jgi:hypothetical protein